MSTERKFKTKSTIQNRVSVVIRCHFGSSTELKFQNRSHIVCTNFERVILKFSLMPIKKKSKSSNQETCRKVFPKLLKETPLLKTSTPGNCTQNLTNFEAKNILLLPQEYSPRSGPSTASPKSNQKQQHLKDFPRRSIFCQN